MYGINDDFYKAYDPKKAAEKQQIPFLPNVDFAGAALLRKVQEGKSAKRGKYFEFIFEITRATSETVLSGMRYTLRFYPGASEISFDMCWRNMTPILQAALNKPNTLTFDAANALGELLTLSKGGDLEGLAVQVVSKLEPARPDKVTGKIDPKNLDANGQPKLYARYTWSPGVVAQTAA